MGGATSNIPVEEAGIRRLDADSRRAQTPAMAVFPENDVRTRSHAVAVRRFPRPAKDAAQMSVRYAVADYAIDQLEDRNQLISAFEPLSDGHYRWHVKESFGSGRYEFCGLTDGFFVTFAETEYHTPQAAYFSSPDSLHIYLASSGDGEYVPVDGAPLSFEAPSTVFIVEPADQPLAEVTLTGITRYIYIVMHREVLRTLYAGSAHELPALLQAFLDGDLQQTSGRALPLSAAMLRCLEDVQTCPLDGRRRRLFLQSKALEIVCQTLEAFDQSECFRSAETTKLTARGVVKAQRFLEANYVTPPSLDELAAQVGLSRSALCTGFRQILGQSIFDYVQDLRMQRALALLSESDDPITQIAYAVGYNRSSSFSVAVHRHFGTTPSKLRRRGASPAN